MKNPALRRCGLPFLVCALFAHQAALAQSTASGAAKSANPPQKPPAQDMSGMDMSGMDMSGMDHSKMGPSGTSTEKKGSSDKGTTIKKKSGKKKPKTAQAPMDHSTMDHPAASSQATPANPQKNPPAQDMSGMDHSQMDHLKMGQAGTSKGQEGSSGAGKPETKKSGTDQAPMDHSTMNHSQMDMSQAPQPAASGAAPPAHQMEGMGSAMGDMNMGPMQGGKPPPDARDPNAYAEGARHANLPGNEMMDDMRFGRLLLDNAELSRGDGEHGQRIEAEAWYGGDYNKLWLKAEGERTGGRLESLRTEALWDRTFATFWSTQVGMRHDTGGGGDSRNWVAAGVRGLAPYWFDIEATAYARSGGGFAARFEGRYELLFTQRLILEPQLEANLYSRADPERGIGTGLSDLDFGMRLRYEITRQFAPYIGVTWNRKFGGTAELAKSKGEDRKAFRAVAGLRIWF